MKKSSRDCAAASLSGGDLMQDSGNSCEKKTGINYCKAMKVGHVEDFITIPTKVYETLMGCSGEEDEFMQVSTIIGINEWIK